MSIPLFKYLWCLTKHLHHTPITAVRNPLPQIWCHLSFAMVAEDVGQRTRGLNPKRSSYFLEMVALSSKKSNLYPQLYIMNQFVQNFKNGLRVSTALAASLHQRSWGWHDMTLKICQLWAKWQNCGDVHSFYICIKASTKFLQQLGIPPTRKCPWGFIGFHEIS